jgi:hypothetical protein
MDKRKAKFQVGQVVRVNKHYFRITRHVYDPTGRVARWDNGHWYYEGNSQYSEHCVRALTKRETNQ